MRGFRYLIFVIVGYLSVGCGGGGGNSSSYSSPPKAIIDSIYVNTKIGIDGNIDSGYGSYSRPFKTISHAIKHDFIRYNMTEISKISSIYIAGGNYTKENGEMFPINLPKGINLLTYDDDSNRSVEINATQMAIILNGDNRLSNLLVSSQNSTAILSKDGNNSLNFTTIKDSKNAISILNSSSLVIKNSIIRDNSHSGIELSDNSTVKLINSEINNSNIGIFISDSATVDINSKNSKIKQNKQCDFFTDGNSDIKLQGIEWDDDIFEFNIKTSCTNGNNIVNVGEGRVSYQTIPNEELITREQLFPSAKNRINILSPKFEEAISTLNPTIKYSNNLDSKYIMLTIWNKIPKVIDNKIINSKDIFWYWHTGMKMDNSSMGIIDYTDGRNPIEGDINSKNENKPIPLKKGRAYYIAIWEWDSQDAIEIVSSSSVSIFYVYQ